MRLRRPSLRIIEVVVAAILLAAAGLKADQLFANGSPVIPGLIHYRTWLALFIEAEFLLTLWLLFGGFPRARRLCAMGCFGLFAVAAGYEALRAMPSCGCFGNIKVPPIITALFDVSAVVALWLAKPVANCRGARQNQPARGASKPANVLTHRIPHSFYSLQLFSELLVSAQSV